MSRLAFDDLMKSSSLDPIASRAGVKSRTDGMKTEKSSSFDERFKQAVEELQPKEEKSVAAGNDDGPSGSKEIPSKNDPSGSDVQNTAVATDVRFSTEPTDESSEPEDADDVLIAMVMAAGGEQEQPVDGKKEGGILVVDNTAQKTATSAENLTGEICTTLPIDTGEPDTSQQDANQTKPNAPILASSEIVVPVETETNTKAARATVSTTAETIKSEAVQGAMGGLEALQQVEASEESVHQQGNMDTGQDSDLEEGEIENKAAESEATMLQTAATAANSASASKTPSHRGDELAVETTDKQKTKTETSAKVDMPTERPVMEQRSGQSTSTTATPSSTESTLDTADQVRFVERVAQAFQAQSSENSPVRMRLHPEELGAIKIEMTVRNGTMHARIETETQEARHLLLDNLPALRERLATQHNIRVEQFDINYNAGGDQQGAPQSPEDWSDSGRNGSPAPNEGPVSDKEDTEAITPSAQRAASLSGSGKQLDVTA